mgnify:CR=1 FL=1
MITIENILIVIMYLLCFFQLYSLIYCIKTVKSPIETHYGFSMWGIVPVLIISAIIGVIA